MKAHQIAAQFASYIQLHMAPIEQRINRHKMVQFCALAWNISLFPKRSLREAKIEMAWKVINSYLQGPSLPGLELSFKNDLKNLILQKLYLFPYTTQALLSSQWFETQDHAWIRINTRAGCGEAPLTSWLDVQEFPAVINALRDMGKITNKHLVLMGRLQYNPKVVHNEFIERLLYTYCLQRSNLFWYQLMIEVWQQQTHPKFRPVIGRWLHFIEKLKDKTQAVFAEIDKVLPEVNTQVRPIAAPLPRFSHNDTLSSLTTIRRVTLHTDGS